MNTTRIIGRLDIKGPNLVKGVHLEGLRVMGDPKVFAEQYYKDGIDEMIYMDSVASLYGRNSLKEFVEHTAKTIFVPLTVGGGVRTLDDISSLLKAGADKVAINTAVIFNPDLIKKASRKFGAQCIVVSIEAKKISVREWTCFTDNGRESTGLCVLEWAKHVENLGAGEILLTSVDYEGTGFGYDIELTRSVSELVSIPVIASGGCGNMTHIRDVIVDGKADAIALASVLHYEKLRDLIDHCLIDDYVEGNINYLRDYHRGSTLGRKNISPLRVKELKNYLLSKGVHCRI